MTNPVLVHHSIDAGGSAHASWTFTPFNRPTPGNTLVVSVAGNGQARGTTVVSFVDNCSPPVTIPILAHSEQNEAGLFTDVCAIAAYTVPAVLAGTYQITITFGVTTAQPTVFVQEWSADLSPWPAGGWVKSGGNPGTQTGTITLSTDTYASSYLVQAVAFSANTGAGTDTPATGWTDSDAENDWNTVAFMGGAMSYRPASSAAALASGTYAGGWTFDAGSGKSLGTYAACGISLQLAGSPAPVSRQGHYLYHSDGTPFLFLGYGEETRDSTTILDQLVGKINVIRAFAAGWDNSQSALQWGCPWTVTGGVMDMSSWNATYWTNLATYLGNMQARGLVSMLTLWNGHYDLPGGADGANSMWNSAKNSQGVQWAFDYTTLDSPASGGTTNQKVAYYTRRFIDRLLVECRSHPWVIFEINNEDPTNDAWYAWWAAYVKLHGYVVAVDSATSGGVSAATFNTTAAIDVWLQHDRPAAASTDLTSTIYNYGKVINIDGDNLATEVANATARTLAWESVLSGGGWNDYTGVAGYPVSTKIALYGYLLSFFASRNIPFASMVRSSAGASTGYCLSLSGSWYVVYASTGGTFTVDLSATASLLNYEWFNPRTGASNSTGTVSGGSATQSFTAPDGNDWVLFVASAATQVAIPVSLVANPGGWTDDLGSSVSADLVAAACGTGGRYLKSPVVPANASITFRLGISAGVYLKTPKVGTRTLSSSPFKSGSGGTIDFVLNLRNHADSSLVQTFSAGLANVPTTETDVDVTQTNTPADWSGLDLEIVANQSA